MLSTRDTMALATLEDLERAFKALANINRLRLIVELQNPKGYGDIDLAPSRGDSAGSGDRSISRQAVRGHIQELMDLGVVVEAESDGPSSQFIVDHARLFALFEQARRLTAVQPSVDLEGTTLSLDGQRPRPTTEGPHLTLVRGVEEGRGFPLRGKDEEEWTIGRSPQSDISLDYDAYVSGKHARVLCQGGDYYLMDLPSNKNGTFLNWQPLSQGGVAPLAPGDIIGVGMSLLVFRDGS
ncbi:MAG: FHA domain-containing protein [Candidatus Thermoplasmatota archaeon]|nr:FHA domain-containing protein [Candidatus Thermoplasmatota archaeon]